jgi:hypothetical protein
MDYLVYVAHDAESLQFFLWYRDYSKRFNALNQNSRELSPVVEPTFGDGTSAKSSGKSLTVEEKSISESIKYPLLPNCKLLARLIEIITDIENSS